MFLEINYIYVVQKILSSPTRDLSLCETVVRHSEKPELMIRILTDKLGTGHKDMFMQIDSLPNYSKTVDSYFLADFFNQSEVNGNQAGHVKLLIQYWLDKIQNCKKGDTILLPIDLSDQYIGCVKLEQTKLGLKIELLWTEDIQGWSINVSDFAAKIEKCTFKNEVDFNWLISKESIVDGLNWSLKELH